MARTRSIARGLGAAATGLVLLASGCGALDRFEEGGASVFVFATHHATPENGLFPNRGNDTMPRTFFNAEGWTVTLLEAYVTIDSVTLIGCNGSEYPLTMFWGPCPEDFRDEDLETLTVAGDHVDEGHYCTLRVEYAAYHTPVIDEQSMEETRHETPSNPAVQGNTIYLRGGARLGDEGEFTQFEVGVPETVTVDLDMSNLEGEGRPMHIAHREDFPKELLVSKTYDRFFDGLDFSDLSPEVLGAGMGAVLEAQTRVTEGTIPEMDPAP